LEEMVTDVLEKAAAFDMVVNALQEEGFTILASTLRNDVQRNDVGEHMIRKAASYSRIMKEACDGENRGS